MTFIADLHIHSHFSRATSPLLAPENLDYWAGIKGIKVVGTGDFTHPGWLAELREKLEPDGDGLFRLKKEFRLKPFLSENDTRFILTAEISSIYKRGEKTRKVHNVLLVPGFDDAEKINNRLVSLGGNLKSDGRPILGLDSRDLLEIVLECNPSNLFIPAHIWTPWFSVLGSKSGFDSIEECFADLSPYIFAVETGLSSDAPMNWLCSFLDRYILISNSDAHSPDRLGRNANIFHCEPGYSEIAGSLKDGASGKFGGTIDLFPQEGKYHYDGHRNCNICWSPAETIRHNFICPVCQKPVTVGVMNRVVELSDREDVALRPGRLPFYSIIPLDEILSEINNTGPSSKKVQQEYRKVLSKLGPELGILLNVPIGEIGKAAGPVIAEAVRRMRNREVIVSEGYDGEYGKIRVFRPGEAGQIFSGNGLFSAQIPASPPKPRELVGFDMNGLQELIRNRPVSEAGEEKQEYKKGGQLNPEQKAAVEYVSGPSLVLAGPGTGKTKTLAAKIAYLVRDENIEPGKILAITFTNKAAAEMKERLEKILPPAKGSPFVATFHALGRMILQENCDSFHRTPGFFILGEEEKESILKTIPLVDSRQVKKAGAQISAIKQGDGSEGFLPGIAAIYEAYEQKLASMDVFDFDDLIAKSVELLAGSQNIRATYQGRFTHLFIDEYQDTNKKQYELVKLLAVGENPNLCVVGDPDQSIYAFRGASPDFIRRFTEDFPGARAFALKTSYRCSQKILSASANVIGNSGFLTGLSEGVSIQISEQATDKSEAEFIARQIVEMAGGLSFFSLDSDVSKGFQHEAIGSLSDFAVLCRTRNQFAAIEKAFSDHNIPYQVVGNEPFYRAEPLSNLLKIYQAMVLPPESLYSAWLSEDLGAVFKEKTRILHNRIKSKAPVEGLALAKSEFFSSDEIAEPEFKRLLSLAENYRDPGEFLSSLKMGAAADTYNEKLECVTLMTLHSSKGLEFQCVFIAGCEDGLIPYTLYKTETDPDEESRLLYVGMTRAKKFLYLSHAKSRNFRGRALNLPRSGLIGRIENELLQKLKQEFKRKNEEPDRQLSLF